MEARAYLLLSVPAMGRCVSMGVAKVEAAAVSTAVVPKGTVATRDAGPPKVKVHGTV